MRLLTMSLTYVVSLLHRHTHSSTHILRKPCSLTLLKKTALFTFTNGSSYFVSKLFDLRFGSPTFLVQGAAIFCDYVIVHKLRITAACV